MTPATDLNWGFIGERDCVLRYVSGPHLHGVDDPLPPVRDEVAVVIEPPEFVIAGHDFRPRAYRIGSLRLTELSLREFVHRVLDGNLTTMLPLLAPEAAIAYRSQVGMGLFPESSAMLGGNLPRNLARYLRAKRDELKRQGPRDYDSELAALLVRLGHQGLEAIHERRVTLPVPEPLRSHLRTIATDRPSLAAVIEEVDELIDRLDVAPVLMRDPPVEVEYEQWLISVYREHWDKTWKPAVLE